MTTKFTEGTIQIGRQYRSDDDERCISIEITDKTSHVQFVEIKLTLAEFADAVFQRGSVPCEFHLRCVEKVGMIAENKEEFVPVPHFAASHREEAFKEALKPFEVDGWVARGGDMGNHHRYGAGGYRVVFFRHVPATKKTP